MIVIKTKLKEMPKSCAQCYAEYDTGCPHLTCYENMPHCELPSVQPRRMKGKWIKRNGVINCSNCKQSGWSESFEHLVMNFKYCLNCGAEMEKDKVTK